MKSTRSTATLAATIWGVLLAALPLFPAPLLAAPGAVTLLRTPNGGLQPQAAVDGQGVLHLIYFRGSPEHGDIFYVHKKLGAAAPFSTPIRVNSHARSACALGTIRGAQLAVGRKGRVYVVWNGSDQAPKGPGGWPMLFTRLDDAGTAFEPERDLITWAGGIDGGGSVAADAQGDVYVTWHASREGKDEAAGGVYLARSRDDGAAFSAEKKISASPTGQCGGCSMKAFVDHAGTLYVLYRAAGGNVNRDATLLVSGDQGRTFQSAVLQPWKANVCPMSSFSLAEGNDGVVGAWETAGQVYFAGLNGVQAMAVTPAPGIGSRKYPVVASCTDAETLLAWVEGAGWQRGGSLAWQVYNRDGSPQGPQGRAEGVPTWSLVSAVARPDGSFVLVY